jgi:hypothetical protein
MGIDFNESVPLADQLFTDIAIAPEVVPESGGIVTANEYYAVSGPTPSDRG